MSSKISLNQLTPTKSVGLTSAQSISPKKSTNKIYSNIKNYQSSTRNQLTEQQSAKNSLVQKIIENKIAEEQEYQNLLIRNKELQIKILALQQEAQKLKKQYKKSNKPLQQIKAKMESARISLIQKQKYLQKFYVHLDSKLKSNMQSHLFGKLEKIQSALQQKYSIQKNELYANLQGQHLKIQTATQQLQRLRQYRDILIKQYTQKAIESSSNRGYSQLNSPSRKNSQSGAKNSQKKSNPQKSQKNSLFDSKSQTSQNKREQLRKRKQDKIQAKKEAEQQCQYLKQNIKKLRKQKQIVEKDEKILKLLLNIEQEHKKYSGYILNGYKKMFTIKYRQILGKRKSLSSNPPAVKQPSIPLPDVDKLQKTLGQKIAQRKALELQIKQRNISLQACKQKLHQQIGEYSQLEQNIMEAGNKSSSRMSYNYNSKSSKGYQNQEYNPRSTYGGANYGMTQNNRSTYTSYQKKSFDGEEDL